MSTAIASKHRTTLLCEPLEDRRVLSRLVLPVSVPLSILAPAIMTSTPANTGPSLLIIDPATPSASSPSAAQPASGLLIVPLSPNQFLVIPFFSNQSSAAPIQNFGLPSNISGFPSTAAVPSTPGQTGPGNVVQAFPPIAGGGQPAATVGGTPENGINPAVPPPTTVAPQLSGTPSLTGTQTIGLLAFPIIPTYPLGMAFYAAPQPYVPRPNRVHIAGAHQKFEEHAAWLVPTDENPDETVLTPEQLEERRWHPDIPPADNTPSATPATPPQQAPSSEMALPPADADVSWNLPPATRVRAIEELLRESDQVRPAEIAFEDGWAYGLVAAGLAGTFLPEAGAVQEEKKKARDRNRIS